MVLVIPFPFKLGERETVTYYLDGLAPRGQDTEGRQRPSVYYNFAVDKNFVFAVPSMFGIDFNLELSSQPRRHPDGMKSGDSIRTITNQYSSHSCFFTSTHR